MIKKINIALAVAFAAMFVLKGLKSLKESGKGVSAARQDVASRQAASQLAPRVYYGYWAGYTLENPISNRNGVLLDIVRAIFPNATFRHVHGDLEGFARSLREDAHGVVVGFGEHPLLKDFPVAPTPLMHCPLVLMTLRTNPWRYKDVSSLYSIRIVADESFLDYKVIRELRDRQGKDSQHLRLMPSVVSKVEMAELVENGEADAFVMADLTNREGITLDGLTSVRLLHRFRKSTPIANDGTLLYASGKDADFAKRLIAEYEEGMRRIEKSGQLRRIFEYYGISCGTMKSDAKTK